jgi:heme/copper-type cytochrome/quinol oxidase subunit 3
MQKQDLLEEALSYEEQQDLRNKRAGMFIFQVSWIMAFLCLVVVNWQLRFSPNWKPEGTQEASTLIGLFATLTLIGSTVLVYRALQAMRTDDERAFEIQWAGAIALGALFVVVMIYEWLTIQTGTQYAQVFRLMTGFHMFHALVIGGYMAYVYQNRAAYDGRNYWAVEAGAKLWYFVLVAWMIFYIVIYWI